MPALMSSSEPTEILPPNPPFGALHRKPTTATPKPARPAEVNATMLRLKNWRRVTPMVSGSGGTYGAGSFGSAFSSAPGDCAATAASSTSRPVGAGGTSISSWPRPERSRWRVSRESAPSPRRESWRRAVTTNTATASSTSTATMAMTAAAFIRSTPLTARRRCRSSTGSTKFCPGPRKNEPMITRTAQNIMKMVKTLMVNLRSSGLMLGLRSM